METVFEPRRDRRAEVDDGPFTARRGAEAEGNCRRKRTPQPVPCCNLAIAKCSCLDDICDAMRSLSGQKPVEDEPDDQTADNRREQNDVPRRSCRSFQHLFGRRAKPKPLKHAEYVAKTDGRAADSNADDKRQCPHEDFTRGEKI